MYEGYIEVSMRELAGLLLAHARVGCVDPMDVEVWVPMELGWDIDHLMAELDRLCGCTCNECGHEMSPNALGVCPQCYDSHYPGAKEEV